MAYQMALKDLARFYFGHAMLAETLAVLRDDPAPDPALLMASHILLDRPMDEPDWRDGWWMGIAMPAYGRQRNRL
ncbi:hypothetical protein JCM17846_09940 [Iodidimonas nitroreducens]|uniref:Uncharacterized protein n=1 Tax=Iodidimonas nitroreducens TaxID=1236968 RepID=A0A5A7N4V1_9PROT|nr:hypothetical protein [Iodidimonas nitroreducens]GER03312.1 hypothetical protein JCM17846_09940 [Iodidimonas nitroreducens]